MSMITYPLNDIEYTAEDAELFHCTRTSGIFSMDDFNISVSGADYTVVIEKGIGWIRNSHFSGKVTAQKEPLKIDLGFPDSKNNRIDAVVIRFDKNANKTEIVVKQGVASEEPEPPEVTRTELVYELHLYQVLREVGELEIGSDNVVDVRGSNVYCGIMSDGTAGGTSNIVLDETLSVRGMAADSGAVGVALEALPIKVSKDNYTDIYGQRQSTNFAIVKSDNEITITQTLQGGVERVHVMELDSTTQRPLSITVDNVTAPVSWDGF